MRPALTQFVCCAVLLPVLLVGTAIAQQMPAVNGRQYPLNQMSPVGQSAMWARQAGSIQRPYMQPVKFDAGDDAAVTVFGGSYQQPVTQNGLAQFRLLVGQVYRVRIANLPEFPGQEFFPSIELIDRLHPPTGQADNFPIEIPFTTEEFEVAAQGRLVTKVIYLEQPDRIPTAILSDAVRTTTIEPSRNAIAEADSLGRPMAIVRLGGRMPDAYRPDPSFFEPGGPIEPSRPVAVTRRQSEISTTGKRAGAVFSAGVVSAGK